MDYFKNFKAGDLITSYWKGYYTFIEYVDRGNKNPVVRCRLFADANGKIRKGKTILECDAYYCKPAAEYIKAEIEKKKTDIANLSNLL